MMNKKPCKKGKKSPTIPKTIKAPPRIFLPKRSHMFVSEFNVIDMIEAKLAIVGYQ